MGAEDSASHAYKGKTPRNRIMFEAGGVAYVYLCYGIHHLLNIVCGEENQPQGVMIRGVEGVIGPGRVTKLLGIDRAFYGENLTTSELLWLEDDGYIAEYSTHKRVGIDYALPKDIAAEWRFVLEE